MSSCYRQDILKKTNKIVLGIFALFFDLNNFCNYWTRPWEDFPKPTDTMATNCLCFT